MNILKQSFDGQNETFSDRKLEFSVNDQGLIIETIINGKIHGNPKIIPGADEREIKMWFYDYQHPMWYQGNEGFELEWYEIELDDSILKAYYYEHLKEVKTGKEDGTW